jgi:hypothetical protein
MGDEWSVFRPGHFNLQYLLVGRLGKSQSLSGRGCEEKESLPCRESNSDRPTHSIITTLTELPRMMVVIIMIGMVITIMTAVVVLKL